MRKPHLLYLAWGFPPSRAGGVYRALATANAFARGGWDVTVVTAERETFERYTGTDPSLEARVAPEVRVVRIPFPWPAQSTDIRTYPLLRAVLPPLWHRLRRLRDQASFPEPAYGPWREPLTAAALDVHARAPVDLVLATANPHVTFAAAEALHRRTGVPFVMDYRDAWRLDVFSGATVHRRWGRVGRWEARVVAAAHEVWFVNGPLRDWHAAAYPAAADRMHVVANGWDPDLLDVPEPRAVPAEGPVRFAYLGTITPKVPLVPVLDGWARAVADGRVPAGSTLTVGGHLGYFSAPQGDLAATLDRARDAGVRFVGPVPKAEVSAFYGDADVLVLPVGTGRYVTSGKVYEYVAARRPVVAVHDPANATAEVLADHPLVARVARVDAAEVADALALGVRLARTATAADRARIGDLAAGLRRDAQLGPAVRRLTAGVVR